MINSICGEQWAGRGRDNVILEALIVGELLERGWVLSRVTNLYLLLACIKTEFRLMGFVCMACRLETRYTYVS